MTSSRTLWLAIGLMSIGMIFIPMGDGIAKHVQAVTPYQPVMLSWARFSIGALVLLPFVLTTGQLPSPTYTNRKFWWRQSVRGFLIAATVTLIVTAVGLSPIADVFGAFFIGPGISVILAQWVLGVKATRLDWIAVALGFVGVLLVVQPTGDISPGIPWALASGCCYGAFLVATRWAAISGPPIAQLTAQFSIAALLLSVFGIPQLLTHGIQAPEWITASAVLSASANLLSIIALSKVGNAVLAPVVYLQVVSATFIGVLIFNETPNVYTAVGLALIVATGIMRAVTYRALA